MRDNIEYEHIRVATRVAQATKQITEKRLDAFHGVFLIGIRG